MGRPSFVPILFITFGAVWQTLVLSAEAYSSPPQFPGGNHQSQQQQQKKQQQPQGQNHHVQEGKMYPIGRRSFFMAAGTICVQPIFSELTGGLPSSCEAREIIQDGISFQSLRPIQFIAALGDPDATSGTNANSWGIWTVDPGPRGVFLRDYQRTLEKDGIGPYGWRFDKNDWWLEEHGIIMESPDFPLPVNRRYLVTGGRETTAILSFDSQGGWKLDNGRTRLYDVTHLPCRSARYNPKSNNSCSPSNAVERRFPVKPGAPMPAVSGCDKQDYAVLFVVGVQDVTQ